MLLVGDQGKLANDDDDDEDREEKSVNFRRDSAGPSLEENAYMAVSEGVIVDLLKVCKRFDHGLSVERIIQWIEGCFTCVDIAVVHGQRRRRLNQTFRAGTRVVIHVVCRAKDEWRRRRRKNNDELDTYLSYKSVQNSK